MAQTALLVCDAVEGNALRIARILDLFAIPWQQLSPRALVDRAPDAAAGSYGVVCPMAILTRVRAERGRVNGLPPLIDAAESVFVYGADATPATRELLRDWSQSESATVAETEGPASLCTISRHVPTICGPMSGLQVSVPSLQPQLVFSGLSIEPLISVREGCVFGILRSQGTAWYLASSAAVIDLGQPVEQGYFDVADSLLSAVPIVMYIRQAFADIMLQPVECGACLIIDDPVLRPHYGFIDFHRLARCAVEHNFSCSIAFIPWNWRRSRSSVVELFKRNRDRLSISVHGCDHTGAEFGGSSSGWLNVLAKRASARMEKHRGRTGLEHDAVMVFPQGAFSTVAPGVLKHNGFMAAVNTEVSPLDAPSGTRIADVWQMAILRYADFPIFTRRYAGHGLHNFAFDMLLGKPCLLVAHHDDFQHDGRGVLEFIDRLNRLDVALAWRPLGDLVRRAYRARWHGGGQQVRMFASEIMLENGGSTPRQAAVEKLEHGIAAVDRVRVDDRPVEFSQAGELLRFAVELTPRSRSLVRIDYRDGGASPSRGYSLRAHGQAAARRYLSELRDECQARAPRVYRLAGTARTWLAGAMRR